jgi:hypothetical protein
LPEPLAARCPAAQANHVGLDPGLVDEHQAPGVKLGLKLLPALTLARDLRTVLLSWQQAFLRNNRLGGILLLQDEPKCLRTPA